VAGVRLVIWVRQVEALRQGDERRRGRADGLRTVNKSS
jgi:hypothetical protein